MTMPSPVSAPSRTLRILAWLSFLAETIIIGTGGAVRLTGSGLGCSEWPLCTPGSLVPTPELGIHGIIEFGNRTMTGVVGVLALAVLLLTLHLAGGRRAVSRSLWSALAAILVGIAGFVVAMPFDVPAFPVASAGLLLATIVAAVLSIRSVSQRADLAVLAWIVLVGVVAQGFVGGITVLTGLNPFIVGFHYASSLVLVCVTAAFLVRMGAAPGARERAVPRWYAITTHVTSLVLAVTIAFGVLTTGNGPHSGDADVVRTGFDATLLSHIHSWPGYLLFALVAVLVVAAWRLDLPTRGWATALLAVLVVQIGVGVWQANAALPPLLVGIHMVLAALSAAAFTALVLALKRPAR
ncbi:COX15/CtaA family protein [Microbacterium sp. gxy059]|uniref:COX15/CtaA family protein n=1 Tax=Microbacterium sp. gxy059 TaxID=2957199 RepID=UPI003D985F7E